MTTLSAGWNEQMSQQYADRAVSLSVEACQDLGVDPYPIMAETLREQGWTVEAPDGRP
jgi:hypothetical protein